MQLEQNESVVSTLLRLDPDTIGMVLDFVGSLEDRLSQLARYLKYNNFTDLQAHSHKLSGSAGLHGFPEFSALISMISDAAKHNSQVEAEFQFARVLEYKKLILKGIENSDSQLFSPDSFRSR